MKRFRTTALAVAVLMAASVCGAGTGVRATVAPELLTNETITEMTKAGLGPSVIVAKIHSSETRFDVSTDELIRLKQLGVADEVIEAMIEAAEATAPPDPGGTPISPPDPSDPATAVPSRPIPLWPGASGIYYARPSGQEEDLILLEPNVYTQSKETGVWKQAITYGIAKVRYKAILPNAHANFEIPTRRPSFYFFFDVPNGGLSSATTAWGVATSANEFLLAKMDVKKNTRELEVGEDGQYTGRRYGVSEKATQLFDFERLAPGVYRVTPKQDLVDGEYCFLYAGSVAASGAGGGPKLFDFRIKGAKPVRSRRATKP